MQRNTKQKKLVWDALVDLNHPTAHEVYCFVKNLCPSISKGTIYRILGMFVKENKALHIQIPNGSDCYDYQTHSHYHFFCKKCHCVYDINIPYSNNISSPGHDFKVEECFILYSGLCPNCQKKGE